MGKLSGGALVSGSQGLEWHKTAHNSWLPLKENAPKYSRMWEQSEWWGVVRDEVEAPKNSYPFLAAFPMFIGILAQ